ncbi:MAG: hypothetical protein QXX95_06240 [Nitrososphaerales archaeon]
MNLKGYYLLSPFFIIGFSLPFINLALQRPYLEAFYLLLISTGSERLNGIVFLALVSLILAWNKFFFWNYPFYRSLFFFFMISLIILPSLILLFYLFFMIQAFELGKEIYLSGFAVLFIILPWILYVTLIESVIKAKNSLTLPLFISLLSYSLIELVSLAYLDMVSGEKIELSLLGKNVINNIVLLISNFVFSFANVSLSQKNLSLLGSSIDPYLWALFALTNITYFYYRLLHPKDSFKVFKLGNPSLLLLGILIVSSLLITLALIYLDMMVRLPIVINLNLSMIILLILLWISLPRR